MFRNNRQNSMSVRHSFGNKDKTGQCYRNTKKAGQNFRNAKEISKNSMQKQKLL